MFSVLNSRGLDLSPVDLVKSKIFKNKTTSLKVSKLKGSTYYYSAWSKAKAVKTKK